MKYLLPAFLILPILEMYVLIKVGANIGAFNTVLLVLLTAMIGLSLLRYQGFKTLVNARNKLEKAQLPTDEILTGIFLAVGGALLLTPGFVTDTFGMLSLIPTTRVFIINLFFSNLTTFQSPNMTKASSNNDWIEGEFKKDKDK